MYKRQGNQYTLDRKKYAPDDPDDRALHEVLLTLRDQAYAHTGDNELRRIVDLGPEFEGQQAEQRMPIKLDAWVRIARLCRAQAARFSAAAAEVRKHIDEHPLRDG